MRYRRDYGVDRPVRYSPITVAHIFASAAMVVIFWIGFAWIAKWAEPVTTALKAAN